MILTCFPNIGNDLLWSWRLCLSVKLLSFPFFLLFKVFVWCLKQNFKVSFSKIGVKTGVGREIQYSKSDWFAPKLSFSHSNPGKKGPGVLPLAVWKNSNPLRGLRRGSSDFGQLLTFSLCEKDKQVCYLTILWNKKEAKNCVINPEDFLNVLHLESELGLVLKSSEQLQR